MKRYPLVVALVLVAAVVLSACGGGGAAPSSAARAWFEAFTQFDFNKMKDLTCQKEQAGFEEAMAAFGGGAVDLSAMKDLFQIDISGLKFEDKNVSGNSGTVHISGNFKISALGQSQEEAIDEDIPMTNEGGAWKVCTSSLPGG